MAPYDNQVRPPWRCLLQTFLTLILCVSLSFLVIMPSYSDSKTPESDSIDTPSLPSNRAAIKAYRDVNGAFLPPPPSSDDTALPAPARALAPPTIDSTGQTSTPLNETHSSAPGGGKMVDTRLLFRSTMKVHRPHNTWLSTCSHHPHEQAAPLPPSVISGQSQ